MLSDALRDRLRRTRPILEAVLVLLVALVGLPLLFAGREGVTQIVIGVVLLAALAASWAGLRDFMHGVSIRAGNVVRPGDRVAVDVTTGVVAKLGYRSASLITDDGAELFIPYTTLSQHPILRVPRTRGLHRHSFELELDAGADPLRAIDRIKRLALSSHWSSVVREPEIDALDGRRLRVQVFALGREHGPAIEALIRRGLDHG